MKYLTQELYKTNVEIYNAGKNDYWIQSYRRRWFYHKRAIEIIKRSGTTDPGKVLEMGTMGASIVVGSDTIDINDMSNYTGVKPTYLHDARKLPWPINDKHYEWFIALRVFHHLHPVQKECFIEALRIADNVLIVVPDDCYSDQTGKGIRLQQFTEWNNGFPPVLVEWVTRKSPLMHHYLYCWGIGVKKRNSERLETWLHIACPKLSKVARFVISRIYRALRAVYHKYKELNNG